MTSILSPRLTPVARRVAPLGRFAAPLGRRVTAVLGLATPRGWVVIACGLLSVISSVALGWQELWSLGLALLGLIVVAALFLLGRTAYEITIDLSRDDVVVGEQAVGEILVRNPTERALLPARVELPVGRDFAAFDVPRLPGGAQHDALFGVPTERRAVLQVGPVRSLRGDALGLLARRLRWTDPVDLFVHPRTVRLAGSSSGILRDLEGLPTPDLADDDVSFHALRDYVSGDDLRHVHWKSTARTGTMMVRQFEETRRSHLSIVLSTRRDDYVDDDEFELAVSTVGSLGVQALADGRDLTVVRAGSAVSNASPKRLLDDLSGVELDDHAVDFQAASRFAAKNVSAATIIALVVGSRLLPGDLRRASAQLPSTARVFAVRCDEAGALSLGRIGPLSIITLPDLPSLPRAVARVEP